eukprot:m.453603 g.453603  ORF g.453603 m.453603 type:complete len:108 (-) comp20525_c0_seq1:1546-1869(-)
MSIETCNSSLVLLTDLWKEALCLASEFSKRYASLPTSGVDSVGADESDPLPCLLRPPLMVTATKITHATIALEQTPNAGHNPTCLMNGITRAVHSPPPTTGSWRSCL